MSTPADVPRAVGRVLDLFEIVLDQQPCSLTQAATLCGLTPTTARRHLRALEARGYVERDDSGLFSAGATIYRISAGLRDGGEIDRIVAAAQQYLDALAADTGESAYLAVGDAKTATYIATAESARAIRHVGWVGQNVGLDGTAVGAALAEPGVIASRTAAVEPDITALSLALNSSSTYGLAISVIGPRTRVEPERIDGPLRLAVAGLSRDLGLDRVRAAS